MSKSWQERHLDRFYRSRPGWIDGTTEFWKFIETHAKPGGAVLEIGCGPSNPTSRFLKETFGRLDGLETDAHAGKNEHVDRLYVYDGGRWPLADGSYDTIVANYVLEHLEHPKETLREVARILKPGGVFLFRAPNLWHYVTLGALLTPHWFHRLVANRLRGLPRDAADPCRAFYRMNTPPRVRSACRAAGLTEVETRMIEKEPSYGRSSRLLFFAFMIYERAVNSTGFLAGVRANLLGAWQKIPGPPRQ